MWPNVIFKYFIMECINTRKGYRTECRKPNFNHMTLMIFRSGRIYDVHFQQYKHHSLINMICSYRVLQFYNTWLLVYPGTGRGCLNQDVRYTNMRTCVHIPSTHIKPGLNIRNLSTGRERQADSWSALASVSSRWWAPGLVRDAESQTTTGEWGRDTHAHSCTSTNTHTHTHTLSWAPLWPSSKIRHQNS